MNNVSKVLLGVASLAGTSSWLLARNARYGSVSFDIAPDGKHLVFTSTRGELFLLHLGDMGLVQLTTGKGIAVTPAFVPGSQDVIYVFRHPRSRNQHVWARSPGGRAVALTTGEDICDLMPSCSPDGAQIVFARAHCDRSYGMGFWRWEDWDVCVMNRDGTNLRRLTNQKYRGMSSPRFTGDGRSIVFSAHVNPMPDPKAIIFQVDLTGESVPYILEADSQTATEHAGLGKEPHVSLLDGRIAFLSDRAARCHHDVWVMNADGTQLRALGITNIGTYNSNPVWSPDGSVIWFLAGTELNINPQPIHGLWHMISGCSIYSLWRVDADGANARRIAGSQLFTDPLKWKPE